MTKIITVEVAQLLRQEPDCIRARAIGDDKSQAVGCHVEITGPSSVIFDNDRTYGARVWVATEAPVRITNSAGQVKEIP